jgi:hypothetical protein
MRSWRGDHEERNRLDRENKSANALGRQAGILGARTERRLTSATESSGKTKTVTGQQKHKEKKDLVRTPDVEPRPTKMQTGELFSNLRQERRARERSKFQTWNQKGIQSKTERDKCYRAKPRRAQICRRWQRTETGRMNSMTE